MHNTSEYLRWQQLEKKFSHCFDRGEFASLPSIYRNLFQFPWHREQNSLGELIAELPLLLPFDTIGFVYEKHLLAGSGQIVDAMAISPDGKIAIAGYRNGAVILWSIENGKCLRSLKGHGNRVHMAEIAANGRYAVTAGHDGAVKVWEISTGECLHTFTEHSDWINGLAITSDSRYAVSAGGYLDNTVKIWDLTDGRCYWTLSGHTREISAVAITPDSNIVISSGEDDRIRTWEIDQEKFEHTLKHEISVENPDLHKPLIDSLLVTPDGRLLVGAGRDGNVRVWRLEKGTCRYTLSGHVKWVRSIAVTPDRQLVISTGNDSTIRVWELSSGCCRHVLTGHTGGVNSITVTPNGQFAVSAGNDKTVRIWELATGECRHVLAGHAGKVILAKVTPDGQAIVSADSGGVIKVWRLEWIWDREEYKLGPRRSPYLKLTDSLNSIAEKYGKLHNWAAVIHLGRQILYLDPYKARWHYNYALCMYKHSPNSRESLKKARAHLQRTLQLDSGLLPARELLDKITTRLTQL